MVYLSYSLPDEICQINQVIIGMTRIEQCGRLTEIIDYVTSHCDKSWQYVYKIHIIGTLSWTSMSLVGS